jgi:hypothetical protein
MRFGILIVSERLLEEGEFGGRIEVQGAGG